MLEETLAGGQGFVDQHKTPRQCSEPSSPSVLGVRTGRTAGGSPSFSESMDGLGQVGVGPCGVFCYIHPPGWYAQKLQVRDLISLTVYDQTNHVDSVN